MLHDFFFYGTLMSGHGRSGLLEAGAELVGPAKVRGKLFVVDSGAFPALTHGDGIVHGEHWRASPSTVRDVLRITDTIEGYREDRPETSLYLREQTLLLEAGQQLAWTYVWNGDTRWLHPLPSGNWRDFSRRAWYDEQAAEVPAA